MESNDKHVLESIIKLKLQRFFVEARISPDFLRRANVTLEEKGELIAEQIIAKLNFVLTGEEYEEERSGGIFYAPATWWDHLLDTIAPKWLRKLIYIERYPIVTLHKKTVIKVCPHLPVGDGEVVSIANPIR
jgi:hypothetical protein